MRDAGCRDAIGKWHFGEGQVMGDGVRGAAVCLLSKRLIMLVQETLIQG